VFIFSKVLFIILLLLLDEISIYFKYRYGVKARCEEQQLSDKITIHYFWITEA